MFFVLVWGTISYFVWKYEWNLIRFFFSPPSIKSEKDIVNRFGPISINYYGSYDNNNNACDRQKNSTSKLSLYVGAGSKTSGSFCSLIHSGVLLTAYGLFSIGWINHWQWLLSWSLGYFVVDSFKCANERNWMYLCHHLVACGGIASLFLYQTPAGITLAPLINNPKWMCLSGFTKCTSNQ